MAMLTEDPGRGDESCWSISVWQLYNNKKSTSIILADFPQCPIRIGQSNVQSENRDSMMDPIITMPANTQTPGGRLNAGVLAGSKNASPRPNRWFPFRRWIIVMGCCLVASIAAGAGAPWPMFQGNAAHTGYVPVTLNSTNFALKWQTTIHSGVALNPVTEGDGMVFVSEIGYFSASTGLYVLDAANGNQLWSVNYGEVFSVNPPSYAGGNVYIETGKGTGVENSCLRAYDAATGALVFRSAVSAQWERYYAPTIYDGKVYVDGGYFGGMYGFDADSGNQLWFSDLNQYDQWTPAVDDKYAYAYTGEYSPNLAVVDRLTGVEAFSIPDPAFQWNGWSMDLAPVLGSANDVLAIHDGRLICFDLTARDIRWQLQRNFEGQPTLAGGVIYAISLGALEVRDEVTGELLWAWEVPADNLTGTMIVTGSHLLACTGSAVYAVNLQTHLSDWSYPVSGDLALGDGVLYVAGANGVLTAIELGPVAIDQPLPPISRAGGPYTAQCKGAATTVQLDGSASRDPDGNALTFSWSSDCAAAAFSDPTSPKPVLTINSLMAQACNITLVVSDGQLANTNQTTLTVVDTEAPVFSKVLANPSALRPADHRMISVTVTALVTDACDPTATYRIVSVTSSDPRMETGGRRPDFQITGTHRVLLRAEATDPQVGRVYQIVLQSQDDSGNIATNTVTVDVPGTGRARRPH